jgi:Rod binding domain-containing protein
MDELKLKITDFSKHITRTPEITDTTGVKDKTKLAKASKDFESLMTTMLIKSMTQENKGMFGEDNEGFGNDMMSVLFESQLADMITKSKGLGIAEMIYKKLTGENLPITIPIKTNERPIDIKTEDNTAYSKVEPSRSSLERLKNYEDIIKEAAEEYGVPENIIKSVILTESAANPRAISKCKAKGLMQLMDGTAKDMGVRNVWDARENIFGGTKYLSLMLRQYNGDLKLALAAYNAGPGNVDKYNGIPPFNETKQYVARVFGYLKNWENENES